MGHAVKIFLKLVLLAALIAGFSLTAHCLGVDRLLDLEGLRSWIDSWGPLGPLAFIGLCVVGIVFYLPESALLAAGGALFGGWQALLYGWTASVLGTTTTFLIARYLARDYVHRTFGGSQAWFQRFDRRFSENGFLWVLLLRMVLGLLPPLNWAVGVTSVRFGSYLAGTAIGVIPNVAVFVYFGGSLARALEEGAWLTPQILVPAALVLAVIVASLFFGRRLLGDPGDRRTS